MFYLVGKHLDGASARRALDLDGFNIAPRSLAWTLTHAD